MMERVSFSYGEQEVLKNFPNVTIDDIYACLDFAKYATSEKIVAL